MRGSFQNFITTFLVSFSMTSIGVILIYFLNKKKNNKRTYKLQYNSLEIEIPDNFIPLSIDHGRLFVKDIELLTDAVINFNQEFYDNTEFPKCTLIFKNDSLTNSECSERKVNYNILNKTAVKSCEKWIPKLEDNNMIENERETFNKIDNLSNAKIILDHSIDSASLVGQSRVIINGTAKQIDDAISLMESNMHEGKQAQIKTETYLLTRASSFKTSPIITSLIHNFKLSKNFFNYHGQQNVFVCASENPSQFYVQVIGPENALLDDLVKEMTEYYKSKENREVHALKNINTGQIVAAKFSVDNKWYRAEVVADLGEQKYDIYFVDFGDRQVVQEKNIAELPIIFLSLRLQAIECCLADVKSRHYNWSPEASMAFAKMCALSHSRQNRQTRVAEIKGYKERTWRKGLPIPCIDLYKQEGDMLINIGKELIKLDLACPEIESSLLTYPLPMTRRTASPEIIEEIDLTITPKMESAEDIEVIDLTSPIKESKNDSFESNFIEDKRNSAFSSRYVDYRLTRNPFKREVKELPRNIIPAGYESEDSSDYDDFDVYSG